jgi:hypothetical protein
MKTIVAWHVIPTIFRRLTRVVFLHSAEEIRAGVGCESCHGEAKDWLEAHTSPKWKLLTAAAKRARGMTPTWDILGYATRCAGCHVDGAAAEGLPLRDVNHDLIAAGHPRLQFELTAYLANLPQHWSVATEKKKLASFEAEAWVLGQLASARAALELLDYRARTTAPWPEFAEYDCSACHHNLHQPSWRQQTTITRAVYQAHFPGASGITRPHLSSPAKGPIRSRSWII